MKISGGCFCGALRYEATIDPSRVGICHCRDCQIFSGSAFRTVGAVRPSNFRFVQGEPAVFEKTAETGRVRRMAFCGRCGTHICSLPEEPDRDDAFVSIRIATSEQFREMRPAVELFCDSKVAWMSAVEGAVQFSRMPELTVKWAVYLSSF